MTSGSTDGLRARKKNRTREEIQHHAIELFTSQGYAATTVEQIAAAADVSPRTVYRYFPTKDALVVTDEYDDRLVRAFAAQPKGLTAIQAFRNAYTEVFRDASSDALETSAQRRDLIVGEPELQAAMLRTLVSLGNRFIDIEVERTGRPESRRELALVVGAVVGIALIGTVVVEPPLFGVADTMSWVDEALGLLEHGFRD